MPQCVVPGPPLIPPLPHPNSRPTLPACNDAPTECVGCLIVPSVLGLALAAFPLALCSASLPGPRQLCPEYFTHTSLSFNLLCALVPRQRLGYYIFLVRMTLFTVFRSHALCAIALSFPFHSATCVRVLSRGEALDPT